jgi:hypothetical protein
MKILLRLVLGLLILVAAIVVWLWPRYPYLPAEPLPWTVERLPDNPLLANIAEERGYVNINGPTVIRVPDWVQNPLGQYYMYFAHHKGSYIRMAYADSPAGPWTFHEGGVLSLAQSGFPTELATDTGSAGLQALFDTFSLHVVRDYLLLLYRATVTDRATRKARGISAAANKATHVASPEILIDDANQRLLMYFHGYNELGGQSSRIASSGDGLNFEVGPGRVFSTYLRAFAYRDQYYLLGMPGVLYRSDSPNGPFVPRDRLLFEPAMRHAGLLLEGSSLYVFWSMVGQAPEGLVLSRVDLSSSDWDDWQASAPVDVLSPEFPWEGSELPVLSSLRGEMDTAARDLRDPYVLRDADGQLYLYYVGGGEKAIGMAYLFRNTNLTR